MRERDDAFATIAMLACLVSAGIAVIYWIARIGFANPVLPVLKALLLSMFLLTAPFTIRAAAKMSARQYTWPRSYSFLWIAMLPMVALLGLLVPVAGVNLFYPLAMAGVAGFVLVSGRALRTQSWRAMLMYVGGAGAFATWAAGVVWGRIYKNPLFFENLAASGVVHHDGLHLSAFSNMLRTYGAASTGIDGLPHVPYHWGTLWLFAQFSNLLGSSVLDFYQLVFPVVMIPFFFGGALGLASEVLHSRSAENRPRLLGGPWFWVFFLAVTIGVIPIEAMDAVGVWTSNLVISESYTVAVPVALLLGACTMVFWRGGAEMRVASGERFTTVDNVFLVAVLPLGVALLGYLKISLMVLAFVLAMYIAVRLRLYSRRAGALAMILTTVLVALTYPRVSLPAHNEGLAPFDFVRNYVPRMWWVFYPVIQIFWSLVYVGLRLFREKITTFDGLWNQIKARRLLDVEAVLLVALAGLAPGMLVHIDGGSAFYFSDVQRWFALGLLLALPPLNFTASRSDGARRLAPVALLLLAAPLLATMALNTVHWPKKFAQANAATRLSLYPASVASSIPAGIDGLPFLARREMLRQGLERSPNYPVADQLRRLGSLRADERSQTAVFIPQSERKYWDMLARPGACAFSSLVAPALSSMAMIDGMPPHGCALSQFYGFGQYSPRLRPQTTLDAAPSTICRAARASGLKRVLTLHFDSSAAMVSRVTECTP